MNEVCDESVRVCGYLRLTWRLGVRGFPLWAQLSPALQRRVIGATFYRGELNKYAFLSKPRWQQLVEDVKRREPKACIAVERWSQEWLESLVPTGEATGVKEKCEIKLCVVFRLRCLT